MKLLLNLLALLRGIGYVVVGLVRVIGTGLMWAALIVGMTIGVALEKLHEIGSRSPASPDDLRR